MFYPSPAQYLQRRKKDLLSMIKRVNDADPPKRKSSDDKHEEKFHSSFNNQNKHDNHDHDHDYYRYDEEIASTISSTTSPNLLQGHQVTDSPSCSSAPSKSCCGMSLSVPFATPDNLVSYPDVDATNMLASVEIGGATCIVKNKNKKKTTQPSSSSSSSSSRRSESKRTNTAGAGRSRMLPKFLDLPPLDHIWMVEKEDHGEISFDLSLDNDNGGSDDDDMDGEVLSSREDQREQCQEEERNQYDDAGKEERHQSGRALGRRMMRYFSRKSTQKKRKKEKCATEMSLSRPPQPSPICVSVPFATVDATFDASSSASSLLSCLTSTSVGVVEKVNDDNHAPVTCGVEEVGCSDEEV